jgi:hypothetical protein
MLNSTFMTMNDLISAAKAHYQELGFCLSIKRSKIHKIWMRCDKGRHYHGKLDLIDNSRSRETKSRMSGCPFELVAILRKVDSLWEVIKISEEHNHPASMDLIGHPSARRLKPEEKEIVRQLAESGVGPSQTMNVLRQEYANKFSSKREIYNELSLARKELLGDRLPVQKLLEILNDMEYKYSTLIDNNGSLSCLFFSHLKSLELCKRFGTVFIMDCTYKTNKFGMPLLNVVGVTATYHSFNAGFAFLREEKGEDYIWALDQFRKYSGVNPTVISCDREMALMNAIQTVFPTSKNLLCIWHINKNILANCRKYFPSTADGKQELWDKFLLDWNCCVESKSEDAFTSQWNLFTSKYSQMYSAAVGYIDKTWIVHKDKFVRAFTDTYFHFGSRSTSRGESSHYAIKRYLNLARCDLLLVYKKLNVFLENQFIELRKHIEEDKIKIAHLHRLPVMSRLVNQISNFSLRKIREQHSQSLQDESDCTGLFTKTYGLPCRHTIKEYIQQKKPLELELVHSQWYLYTNNTNLQSTSTADVMLDTIDELTPRRQALADISLRISTIPEGQLPTFLSRLKDLTDQVISTIQEPLFVSKKRGRPVGSKNKSNKRDKGHFEYVEEEFNGRKCGSCGKRGHNSRTCSK